MPTYSYRCTSCDHAFDIQQSFSDDSLTTCPECGQALRKVFNAIGVTFQGSGFYRTDSRQEAKKPATKAAKESSTPAPATASGASASAPASPSTT
jgi:putative FmdB family regulatory protein